MRQPGETVLHKGGILIQLPCDPSFIPAGISEIHPQHAGKIQINHQRLCARARSGHPLGRAPQEHQNRRGIKIDESFWTLRQASKKHTFKIRPSPAAWPLFKFASPPRQQAPCYNSASPKKGFLCASIYPFALSTVEKCAPPSNPANSSFKWIPQPPRAQAQHLLRCCWPVSQPAPRTRSTLCSAARWAPQSNPFRLGPAPSAERSTRQYSLPSNSSTTSAPKASPRKLSIAPSASPKTNYVQSSPCSVPERRLSPPGRWTKSGN